MGKKLLLISLALALVLAAVAPATILAKKSRPPRKPAVQYFTAVMTPTAIDDTVIGANWPVRDTAETNVWPIVDLVEGVPTIVGWIVDGRSIYGSVAGDIAGDFTFTYGGVLDTLQSGSIQGIVAIHTGQGVFYLAARGTSEAEVVGVFSFAEIAEWWGGAGGGLALGVFFAEIYNNAALALIPDGNLTLADIQAWCAAVGLSLVEFFYSIYGDLLPPELDEPTLAAMYSGGLIPPLPGLQLLGGMYGDPLPPLPKTLSAEFSGTVRVDAGTGVYSGINGLGKFQPAGGNPLTLELYPNQHVYAIDGAIQLTGYYSKKPLRQILKFDKKKLRKWMEEWKEQHGQG